MSDIDVTKGDAWRPDVPAGSQHGDESIGELLSHVAADFGDLVATQVELAKVELKEEVSKAGKGAGMLTGAGVSAYMALALASLALAWLLDDVMPRPLAFIIVAAIWIIVAGALYASGRRQLETLRFPPQTKGSLKEDVEWAKQQKN